MSDLDDIELALNELPGDTNFDEHCARCGLPMLGTQVGANGDAYHVACWAQERYERSTRGR